MTLESYDELMDRYASRFRVIVFELPAMGFSASDAPYRFGWEETNNCVAQFVREIARAPSILAFSCAAGLAATDIAVRYPGIVDKLVLIQTGTIETFVDWKSRRDPKRILAKPFIGQWAMKRMGRRRLNEWFELSVADPKDAHALSAASAEAMDNGALWSLGSAYQRYLVPNVPLGIAKQPALGVWGRRDRSHNKKSWRSSTGLVDMIDVVTLDDAGHFPELEALDIVAELITDFAQ
ncbi:MAG: alpha/beta hydrolase [Pseudomonadota bacterium]